MCSEIDQTPSIERVGIHINLNPDIILLSQAEKPIFQIGLECESPRGFDQKAAAVSSAQK
jgi:hypothetical protein